MAKTEKFGVLIEGKETVSKSAKKAGTAMKTFGQKVKDTSLLVKAAFIGMGIVVARFFKSLIDLTIESERAQARLEQQFINLGIATETNIKSIKILADQLQESTGFSNDAFVSSAALAASYGLNAKQIGALLPAMADMAAFTSKTTGSMAQLEDMVKLMGYVMEGQTGRLKLMGITMTDLQKELISTGDRTQKFATFLEAVEMNAGGVAKAMNDLASGDMQDLKNSFADLKKEIGSTFMPVLGRMSVFFSERLREFNIGMDIWASKAVKVKLAMEAIFTDMKWEEAKAEMAEIDKILEEQIKKWTGHQKVVFDDTQTIFENTDATEENTKAKIKNKDAIDALANSLKNLTEIERAQTLGYAADITGSQGGPVAVIIGETENGRPIWGQPGTVYSPSTGTATNEADTD